MGGRNSCRLLITALIALALWVKLHATQRTAVEVLGMLVLLRSCIGATLEGEFDDGQFVFE